MNDPIDPYGRDADQLIAEAERLGIELALEDGRVHVRSIRSAEAQALALALRPRAEEVGAALAARQGLGNVLAMIAAAAARDPAASAVSDPDMRWTYAELMARAGGIATRLIAAGCRTETRVGVAMDRGCQWVAAVLGVMLAGGAYVPLGSALPAERIGDLCRDGLVEMLVGDEGRLDELPEFETMFTPKLTLDASVSTGDVAAPGVEPGQLAYVMMTSGSTGVPKSVMVEHAALANLVTWHNRSYGLDKNCRSTQVTAMSFDAHVWEIFPVLCAGAELIIVPADLMLDFARFAGWLVEREVTHTFLPTPVAESFLAACCEALPRPLRYLLIGGDVLRRPIGLERPVVVNHYGPTEATVVSTVSRNVSAAEPPIGRAITNTRAEILDSALHAIGPGLTGELWLGGRHLARGYALDPRGTAIAFVPDPNGDGARLYRSGDLGARAADGEILFRGRADDQLKVRGIRIDPAEVERAMLAQPSVEGAAVVRSRQGDALVGFCALARTDGAGSYDDVAVWRDLYDKTYAAPAARADEFVGWLSSASGAPIPADEMRCWADETVARIAALGGRRILEVGVGSGILMTRLLVWSERYVACDLSPEALALSRERVAALPPTEAAKATLLVAAADDLSAIDEDDFDVVVLNSVSQYLLGAELMERVLDQLAGKLATGGAIFVGDVRDLRLLPAFELSVATARAGAGASADDIAHQRRIVERERHELLLTPDFFGTWADAKGYHAVSSPKPMSYCNELSRYRFDAVIRRSVPATPADLVLDWHGAMRTTPPPYGSADTVMIVGIPLGDIADELARAGGTAHPDKAPTTIPWQAVADLGGAGWEARAILDGEQPGYFAVQLRRGGRAWPLPSTVVASGPLANDPADRRDTARAVDELRRALRLTLPAYQVPDVLQVLPRLPLTANGKIDRAALAALPIAETNDAYVVPETDLERTLAAWFAENLGVARVGRGDNLYELGANSLAAARVSAHFNAITGIDLRIDTVLESQTVAELAERIEELVGGRDIAQEIMAIVQEPV